MSFSSRDHVQQHSEGLCGYKASSLSASCSCHLPRPCSSPPWDSQQLTRFSLPQPTVLLLGGTRRNEAGRDLRAPSCQKMPQAHAATHKPSAWHAVPLALGPGLGAGASSQAGRRGPLSSKWWAQSPPAPLPVTLHVLQAMLPESSHGAACEQHKRAERASFQPTGRHQTGLQKSFGSKDNSAGLRAR